MANRVARHLRKVPTIAEGKLWSELRVLRFQGYHFRRQALIDNFIVDFVCFSQRVLIEVDGVQHDATIAKRRDSVRDAHMRWLGFSVLRFTNADVMDNIHGCMQEVLAALGAVEKWE